jgi:hypothetical protein
LCAVGFQVFSVIGAAGAALMVLYAFGDWVLLSLVAILLLGVLWSARVALPRYLDELKLVLNLGTVKEGERIIYQGIPWRVEAVGFHAELANPELSGGRIRLPLREAMLLKSRPYGPEERWFPCRKGDWVVLSDATLGVVETQTPEVVELSLLGGSRKTYLVAEFLRQNPTNLAFGFRLSLTCRIDFRHQHESTQIIPGLLRERLFEELQGAGYAVKLETLDVQFSRARTDSLELAILADFSGEAAGDYDPLSRLIHRIALDVCTACGWVIPFPQVTVHRGDDAVAK